MTQLSPEQIKRVAKSVMSAELAGRTSDPRFYGGLTTLPNPDPILRKAGSSAEVYSAIESDAHVMGELRSVYGGLLSYQLRVVDGAEGDASGKDKEAWELCQWFMKTAQPDKGMTWKNTVWNMAKAAFYGYRPHEIVWGKVGQWLLPEKVLDRPNRRFVFDIENQARLLTRDQPVDGVEIEPYKFLITRHMPSCENPYGTALFSSCFWPYTFKHGGLKFFYKFCERYGLPWPIGKYPAGTPFAEQQKLLDALLGLVEDSAAVIPSDGSVDILSANHSGELAQEALVHLCNREMSKALTSQTLATEMRQVGSNAASQTHDERQGRVQHSDRDMVADTFNELFRWITLFNFGDDVAPPRLEFFKQKEVAKERAEIWQIAATIGRPSRSAFHEEMNIPEAESDDDLLVSGGNEPDSSFSKYQQGDGGHAFAGGEDPDLLEAVVASTNKSIADDWLSPAVGMLDKFIEEGKTIAEFKAALPALFYHSLDDGDITHIAEQAMILSTAQGMDNA